MPFTLDVDVLAGGDSFAHNEISLDERGRSIQLSWTSANADEDMELFGFGINVFPAENISRE